MAKEQDSVLLGGQAVIEGVMMRGPEKVATAVRKVNGEIIVKAEPFLPLARRNKFWTLPIVRGAGGVVEMLTLGIRMLNFSAEVAMADEETSRGNGKESAHASGKGDALRLGITVAISLVLAVAVFVVAPLLLVTALFDVAQNPIAFNLTAGAVRLVIFLGYLGLISRMDDVRRLFMYHGAEHKTVFAYEREQELSIDAALRQTRFHPRCGTSFLLVVMVAAILVFSLSDAIVLFAAGAITVPLRLATHLLILPLVAGCSYEVIRFSAKRMDTGFGRLLITPGLWLQRITTREPDAAQLEVAIVALRAALEPAPVRDARVSTIPA